MIPALLPHLQLSDLVAFLKIGKQNDRNFQHQINKKFNSNYCITFSSGRAGLYNILKANNIENQLVLVTAYTCCVVTEAIVQSGNTPVFIDINKDSFNADILEESIRKYMPNLGAIIVTNLYGIICDIDIDRLEIDEGILVISDDALSPDHLIGGDKKVYDYTFISCAVRKPFSCLGGGIVFTDHKEKYDILEDYVLRTRQTMKLQEKAAKFILSLSFFFAFKPYLYTFTSFIRRRTSLLDSFFNERYNDIYTSKPEYFFDMCDFQKRIGKSQLKKIEFLLDRRREIGNIYFNLLDSSYPWVKRYWKMDTPYSHIPFLHPKRNELQEYLLENGIETENYFDYIVPELDQYIDEGTCPRAKHISNQIINLPINAALSKDEVSRIVETVKRFDINVDESKVRN